MIKNFEIQEKVVNLVLEIQKHFRLWSMRNLSIAGILTYFKLLQH